MTPAPTANVETVSVVIPAYKAARTIRRAVDSILAQTRPADEIVIVDDGSPDDLAAALASYGTRVRLVRQPNAGAASARNRGIELATGSLIAFLDADDYWEPHKLQAQLDALATHPELALIASRYFEQAPGQQRVGPAVDDPRWVDRPIDARRGDAFELANRIWTGTVLVRRTALGDDRFIKGLEPAEDRDLWVRIVARSTCLLMSQPLATAVLEPDSLSRSNVDAGYAPMIAVLRFRANLADPSSIRRLEAQVYRGWASVYLASKNGRGALGPAWHRLVRQPASIEAWWIVLKALLLCRPRGSAVRPAIVHGQRNEADLRRHFEIECELANRLRLADRNRRQSMYGEVYNELFRRVPDHPQNSRKADIVTQQAATDRQWRLLSRFTHSDSTYMEIGAGDCHLAMAIAQRARFSYAIDVSDVIASGNQRPKNFAMIVSDGIHVGVPAGAVDVAYSNQLMEHLHPDDAADQLREICKSLAPGGRYICVTPHRFSGPHDISRFFAPEARGFHLKEYTYGELRQLFLAAGFDSTSIWTGLAGRFFPIPQPIVLGIEKLLGLLPRAIQKRLTRWAPARPVFINVLLVGNRSRRPAATTSSAAPDGPVVKVKAA